MTALRPIDSRDVKPAAVEDYPVNEVCAVPGCGKSTESAHHAFSRSKIKGTSYYVSIDGGQPVPHVIGLCGSGTTGHHGDVEEHRAWISLEDGVWSWHRESDDSGNSQGQQFVLVGALDPQPGPIAAKKIKRAGSGGTGVKGKPKSTKVLTINVPAEAQKEDGAEVLRTLIDECKNKWKDERGWSDSVPDYYPIVAALTQALQ